ncbi:uncharacterized protein LOC106658623 [Trichogramma pretiosum]|uniref:uncharacterized protein LOC106658623 n=1 Tax=Trichogramma pretiosum TaxID=7493 RepID=UPI0006C94661|nr:uncharacterized protein LOC106658623 [Trichogramma pretiosum]
MNSNINKNVSDLESELEKLRLEGLTKHVGMAEQSSAVIDVASTIHSSYLFDEIGRSLLQHICLIVSSTASGRFYGDWKSFGIQLGLTQEQIKCIEYDFIGLQDPTYYVLLAFAQHNEATLDKVVDAFDAIKRKDVINRVMHHFDNFYLKIQETKYNDFKNGMYRPSTLPRAPLVLCPTNVNQESTTLTLDEVSSCKDEVSSHKDEVSMCKINVSKPPKEEIVIPKNNSIKEPNIMAFTTLPKIKVEHNILVNSSPSHAISKLSKENLKNKKKYNCIIMLTFAEDGKSVAEKVAEKLRNNVPRIGVLMFQEQEKHVLSGAEEFIEDCFHQVNYIIPILTPIYLERLQGNAHNMIDIRNLDVKYLRYIFCLMRYEYLRDSCLNRRVRCLVPDLELRKVLSYFMHPVLQAWFKVSDLDEFADKIASKEL